MTEPARRGFPFVLTAVVAVCLTILIGLGAWQLQRLRWKEGVLSRIAALQAAKPGPVNLVLLEASRGHDVAYTRVTVSCPGLAAAPFVELYFVREGQAGARLISVCRLSGAAYESLLVDRGFVADTISARPAVDPASTVPVTITGVLRTPEPPGLMAPENDVAGGHWYRRDIGGMAAALKAGNPAPVFLAAETSSNPQWAALKAEALPSDIPNNHLAYAWTWFGLAAALTGVYAAMLWRRRSGQ